VFNSYSLANSGKKYLIESKVELVDVRVVYLRDRKAVGIVNILVFLCKDICVLNVAIFWDIPPLVRM
jgi:hypothetical protein